MNPLTKYEKLKLDESAKKAGTKIFDYESYRRSNRKLAISILVLIVLLLAYGFCIGFVINKFKSSDVISSDVISSKNGLILAKEICKSNDLGRHIRTSFQNNGEFKAVVECELGNKMIN